MSAEDRGWGRGWPHCRRDNVVTLVAGRLGLRLPVRAEVAPLFSRMIAELEEARGAPFRSDWSWGGACRAISGTSTPSNHSWWLAADLDAPENPYASRAWHARQHGARRYPGDLLLVSTMPVNVQAIAAKYGMRWGGTYFTKPDPMHFEFMGTPADAKRIEAATRPGPVPPIPPPPPPPPPAPAPARPPTIEETDDMFWLIKGDKRPEWWLFDGRCKSHVKDRGYAGFLEVVMKDRLDTDPQAKAAGKIMPLVVDQGFVDDIPRSVHDYTLALDMRVRYLQEVTEAAHPYKPVALDPATGAPRPDVTTREEARALGLIWADPLIPRLLAALDAMAAGADTDGG